METKYVRVPFELELAKEISNGSKEGRIVTREGKSVRVVCWDKKDKDFPIVCLVNDDFEEGIKTYTIQGVWNIDPNCTIRTHDLFLEIPEYMTFKDGDVIAFGFNKEDPSIGVLKKLNLESEEHDDYVVFRSGDLCFNEGNWVLNNLRFATESEKQKIIEALKASKDPRAKECLKKLGIEVKQEYEFKAFDKVLVRDYDDVWFAGIFSHLRRDGGFFCAGGSLWEQCIPYEGNEHLLGTTKDYKEEEYE